jgi:hypothetical protein
MAAEPWLSSTFRGGAGGDPLAQAKLALNQERPQDAQRIAEAILKMDARHGQALHVLGCALVMQGRAADAIAPLEQAVRELRDPETDTMLAFALRVHFTSLAFCCLRSSAMMRRSRPCAAALSSRR